LPISHFRRRTSPFPFLPIQPLTTNASQGTASAIVGTYVLAGELSKSPSNIPAALARYDSITRLFVEKVQKLIPGAPQIANPQSEWGIWLFTHTLGVFSHPYMRLFGGLVGRIAPAFGKNEWAVPEYEGVGGGSGEEMRHGIGSVMKT